MRFFNYISSLLCVMLLSSCSMGGAYPYTTIDGDPYKTRLYRLPGGIKLYLAKNDAEPRATAALLLPAVACDTLDALCAPSVHSADYASLYAQIGSHGAYMLKNAGGTAICCDIPNNEIENWATIMRGSFIALPDSFSIVISGDIEFDDVCNMIEKQYSGATLYSTPVTNAGKQDDTHLLFELHPYGASMRRRALNGTLSASDAESLKENYIFALADGFHDNSFRVRMMADALLRGAAPNSAALLADRLEAVDKALMDAAAQPYEVRALDFNVQSDAENAISLSSPLPVEITFPDATELREKQTYDEFHPEDYYRLLVHVDYNGIPQTIAKTVVHYLKESLATSNVLVDVRLCESSLLIEFHGAAVEESIAEGIFALLKEVADGERFYGYLMKNSSSLSEGKSIPANIAAQASEYAKGGERYTGLRNLAALSMQRIFSSSSTLLAFGTWAGKMLPRLKRHFDCAPTIDKANTARAGDSSPDTILVATRCDTLYTITVAPVEGVEERLLIQLFNKAAELSRTDSLCRYTEAGTCLVMGIEDDSRLPFTEKTFDAARSLLMYDLSTYGNTPQSVVREYIRQEEGGYSLSELYDALCDISYSDMKDFHRRHLGATKHRFVIGKGSSRELRSLAGAEGTVYITLDEMFGY